MSFNIDLHNFSARVLLGSVDVDVWSLRYTPNSTHSGTRRIVTVHMEKMRNS